MPRLVVGDVLAIVITSVVVPQGRGVVSLGAEGGFKTVVTGKGLLQIQQAPEPLLALFSRRVIDRTDGVTLFSGADPVQAVEFNLDAEIDLGDPHRLGQPGKREAPILFAIAADDEPADLDAWLHTSARLALARAVHLRLHAFDLVAMPPRSVGDDKNRQKQGEDLAHGLQAFARLAALLRLATVPLAPALDAATLAVLFDQDSLVAALGQNQGHGIGIVHQDSDGNARKRENARLAERFVRAVANVELWLNGYGPAPRPDRDPWSHPSWSTQEALRQFWHDRPDDRAPARHEQEYINGRFFRELIAIATEASGVSEGLTMDLAIDRVTADAKLAARVDAHLHALGARIWDGLKRVWRWLKSALRSVRELAEQWVTNIARVIKQAAIQVYGDVRALSQALIAGIRFALEPVVVAPLAAIQAYRERDGDLYLIAASSTPPSAIQDFALGLRLRARVLAIGAKVMSWLTKAFALVIRGAFIGVGLGLMLALARLVADAFGLRTLADEARTALATLDQLGLAVPV
jgi:hypothetical protein